MAKKPPNRAGGREAPRGSRASQRCRVRMPFAPDLLRHLRVNRSSTDAHARRGNRLPSLKPLMARSSKLAARGDGNVQNLLYVVDVIPIHSDNDIVCPIVHKGGDFEGVGDCSAKNIMTSFYENMFKVIILTIERNIQPIVVLSVVVMIVPESAIVPVSRCTKVGIDSIQSMLLQTEFKARALSASEPIVEIGGDAHISIKGNGVVVWINIYYYIHAVAGISLNPHR
ncbi:hypothetical protein [Azospirillum argentinense]